MSGSRRPGAQCPDHGAPEHNAQIKVLRSTVLRSRCPGARCPGAQCPDQGAPEHNALEHGVWTKTFEKRRIKYDAKAPEHSERSLNHGTLQGGKKLGKYRFLACLEGKYSNSVKL